MKKLNALLGLGFFAASLATSAQTTIYQNGFENSDKPEAGKYSSAYAITPGKSIWGDWVNPKESDTWTEQYSDEKVNGEYCFAAKNGDNNGGDSFSWDRGFKIANLPLKENKSYRVGFWLKTEGEAKLSSWLSIGVENFDKSICTASGKNFGIDSKTIDTEGAWKHYSFVSYYAGQAPMLKVIESQSWVGSAEFPAEFGGKGDTYKNHFEGKFPNEFFFIMNMFSNDQTYYVDDIKIEEDVTFAQASFAYDVIRLDFGYDTNAGELARLNGGFYTIDKSQFAVTVDGNPKEIHAVEAQPDGFVYVFIETEDYFDEENKVTVSFTPNAECPLVYSSDKRPSTDATSEMKVLGFSNETGYYVGEELGDVVPSDFSAADLVSTTPEDQSFDLNDDEIKTVTFTFNKQMTDEFASAILKWNNDMEELELPNIELSADKMSYVITLPAIEDGEYKVVLTGAANSQDIECNRDYSVSFTKGLDTTEDVEFKDIYTPDWTDLANGTFPKGWVSDDNGTIHEYVVMEDGSIGNYNWGGNIGGGGCRSMTGYSGDFNGGAMYWRCMNGANELGTLTYGAQVKDFLDASGKPADDMDPEIGLYLEPGKYRLAFKVAAWCQNNEPKPDAVEGDGFYDPEYEKNVDNYYLTLESPIYDFELTDLNGNVYAETHNIKAIPTVHRAQNIKVTHATENIFDFTITNEGYYVLKFSSTQANAEFLMGGIRLMTMPSKAAFYKQMLAEAAKLGTEALEAATGAEYDGDTKTTLSNKVKSAREDRYTQGSAVEQLRQDIEDLSEQLAIRVENIDKYPINLADAQDAIALLIEENPDYAKAQMVVDAQNSLKSYDGVNPSDLSDEALAEAVKNLSDLTAKINAVPNTISILTWGASQAVELATKFNVSTNGAENLLDDNRKVINGANANSKGALYAKIAAKADLSEYMTPVYDTSIVNEDAEDGDPNYDDAGHPLMFKGINLSAFIHNAHLYRVFGDDGVPGWTITGVGTTINDEGEEVPNAVSIGFNATPDANNPIVDAQINKYGGDTNYDFSQTIEGLPAGIYNVVLQTRTPRKNGNGVITTEEIYYNAQDAEGTWDKYIYAQGDADADVQVAPFAGADGLATTIIKDVKVKDGKLTMGAHEYYVSGAARTWEPAEGAETDATNGWTGTTYVDYANIYYMGPIEGFDYDAAATAIDVINTEASATITDVYNVGGAKIAGMKKGINIVKYSNGNVMKVIVK